MKRDQLLIEAAQDLEEFAFSAAWDKLKELGKLAKDEFMKGYRRGRGMPEPEAPKTDEPKSEPKVKKKPTKKRVKPEPAATTEPKKEPKAKPGLDKRKAARKARKQKKAPSAPTKKKAPTPAKSPATKGKTPSKATKPVKKTKVPVGKAEPAPNAPDKVRIMGKDGKWLYYDKKAYAKMKRGRK